ncbi:ABC transporter ATP-binding protein [Lachnotalea glycerini]|uniref:ABC transporter ATP-binding protein n=1 Tax=Lachnotalea glycerini TaxID=1763509 RepID=A0A371JEP0_9FIRM|nr:ABC transporter ATP-binding protein [Lachnotalea glycerini]RDY31230.1 ABC transporter ATP-binding protein [Lachnotalea glycerini]
MARNKYDIDEELEEEFDFGQLKRLAKYVGPYKKDMIKAIVIMLLSSALSMLIPRFFMTIMDVYIPEGNIKGIVMLSIATMAIVVFVCASLKTKIILTNRVGQNVIYALRRDLFVHLQELPFSYYDDRPHGKIQVRVVNYVNNLSDLLSNGIVNTITDLCSLIFIILFMLSINIKLTFVCMCGIPILAVLIWTVKKKQRRAWQIESNKQSNLNAYIAESLNGIRVTQSFVREEVNQNIFNGLSSDYKSAWMEAVRYNMMLSPIVDTISVLTTSMVYVLGINWMIGGEAAITAGVLIAFTGYISRFWTPITTLASFYNSLLTSISYLERIFETIDEPVTVKDEEGAVDMPIIQGAVEFENVDFAYEDGIKRLDKVSFRANTGESYAIVGPTGAGKTTIINLLSRFYNIQSGKILIDGIDISKVTIRSLRKQMGVMLQDSFIFSGTIMDNIRYGNHEASDEEVIRAAQIVRAHDFIMAMEQGYSTQVNERGSRLSQGQRQLISFARALLANPKILILDEATSSIDTETEIMLQEGLAKLLKGRTSFIIAHRLSTIKSADCIMYIDKGKIVEMGCHEQLMKQKGEYYNLYLSQYSFLA